MCDKDFTSPTSLDIADLLEYDEYDAVPPEAHTSQSTGAHVSPSALPLSEELARALQVADGFTKSAELFLRIDDTSNAASAAETADPTDGEEFAGAFGGGVELQYENEFEEDGIGLEDGFGGFAEATRSYHSMAENENEQLLMEGIEIAVRPVVVVLCYVCVCSSLV